MEEAEARRTLGLLRGELDDALSVAQAAEKRVAAIEKLVEGYIELFPSLADMGEGEAVLSLDPDRPRGQEAVRQVLVANPGKWFTVKLMTRELKERGWLPESDQPENAVRTALTRVAETFPNVRKGVGEKTRQITFAWFEEPQPHPITSPFNGQAPTLEEVDSP